MHHAALPLTSILQIGAEGNTTSYLGSDYPRLMNINELPTAHHNSWTIYPEPKVKMPKDSLAQELFNGIFNFHVGVSMTTTPLHT